MILTRVRGPLSLLLLLLALARAQLTLELPAGFALDAGGTRVRVSGAAALGTDLALGELPLLVEGSLDLAAGVQVSR